MVSAALDSPNEPGLQSVLIREWVVFVQGCALAILRNVARDGRFPTVLVEGRASETGLPMTVDIPTAALRPHI